MKSLLKRQVFTSLCFTVTFLLANQLADANTISMRDSIINMLKHFRTNTNDTALIRLIDAVQFLSDDDSMRQDSIHANISLQLLNIEESLI